MRFRRVLWRLICAASSQADTGFLATHQLSLDEGMKGYDMFSKRADDVMRVVFTLYLFKTLPDHRSCDGG